MTVAVSLMDAGVGALEVTSSGLRSAERAMTSERRVRSVTSAAGAWDWDGRWVRRRSSVFENGITSLPRRDHRAAML